MSDNSHSAESPWGPRQTVLSSTGQKSTARTKYAGRACQECRRRRAKVMPRFPSCSDADVVKCDGNKPSCARCSNRVIDCVYATDDDSRGSAPKSYVRLL